MAKRGMMDQFTDIKLEHPDSVLFFRMGDFYELFHEAVSYTHLTLPTKA